MMEAVRTFETSVCFNETTRCHIPEGYHLNRCRHFRKFPIYCTDLVVKYTFNRMKIKEQETVRFILNNVQKSISNYKYRSWLLCCDTIGYIFWYEVTCVSEERISTILTRTEHHNRHFHCREILISQNTAFLLQNVTYIVRRAPWLRRSVGRLSPRGLGFASGSFHVGFMVEKIELGHAFLFPRHFHCTVALHTLISSEDEQMTR
jgi:hypothetical protein